MHKNGPLYDTVYTRPDGTDRSWSLEDVLALQGLLIWLWGLCVGRCENMCIGGFNRLVVGITIDTMKTTVNKKQLHLVYLQPSRQASAGQYIKICKLLEWLKNYSNRCQKMRKKNESLKLDSQNQSILGHGASIIGEQFQLLFCNGVHSVLEVQEHCQDSTEHGKDKVISSLGSVALHILEMFCAKIIHNVSFALLAVPVYVHEGPVIIARGLVCVISGSR